MRVHSNRSTAVMEKGVGKRVKEREERGRQSERLTGSAMDAVRRQNTT